MDCGSCSVVPPIEDEGVLSWLPSPQELSARLADAGWQVRQKADAGSIPYGSKEELFTLLRTLRSWENEDGSAAKLSVSISGDTRNAGLPRWFPLPELEARFANMNLVELIANREFCSYMQPIVDEQERIAGFEMLLRPKPGGTEFKPYELFEIAHQTGFHTFLDRAARISAIESGARHLPAGIKRFINFLPSSIYNPKHCLTHTFATIDRLGQKPEDYVFEVVETEKIDDIDHLNRIFAEYRRQGVQVALDDVGAGYSTVELMSRLEPDYVKIDRSLVTDCDTDGGKQEKIASIVAKARAFGGTVLAEGIERREEFRMCREIGVHLGQGYLFGRPEPQPPTGLFAGVCT